MKKVYVKTDKSQIKSSLSQLMTELSPTEHGVLEILLDFFGSNRYRIGGITLSQISIAKKLGVARETVNRIIGRFVQMGLFTTQRRFNNSCITRITNWWGTPYIQQELPHYFKRFPIFILHIAMLLSLGAYFPASASHYVRNLNPAIRNGINRSTQDRRDSYRVTMKQKIDLVIGIRNALLRRGETETIDMYKLLAFSEACLNDCIAKMKYSKPKHPYRFFVSEAIAWSKQNNEKPDWMSVDILRMQKLPEFENSRPASYQKQEEVKTTQPAKQPYRKELEKREEIQKREQLACDLVLQKSKEASPYKNQTLDTTSPFTKWLIADLTRKYEESVPESEQALHFRNQLSMLGIII